MNTEMAYLVGLILGNGEIQQGANKTIVTIDIPHKNMWTFDRKDTAIYVQASIEDIRSLVEGAIGRDCNFSTTQTSKSTKISFTKPSSEYAMREIVRLVGQGTHHTTMRMNDDLFDFTQDEKKALLRGIADVTGYVRRSNRTQNGWGHRVYIEVPQNWYMVADIANMLKDVDVPIQTIDFGHPNFRDGNLKKYNEGKESFWKKEHQIKIYANEFLPIGFNVKHKQEALELLSEELLEHVNSQSTHRFYWEKEKRENRGRVNHPGQNDPSLPDEIRGKIFYHWTDLAKDLGYGE